MINPYSSNFPRDQSNGQYADTWGIRDLQKQVGAALADRDEIVRRIRENKSTNSRKLIEQWDEYAAAEERVARLEKQLNAMQATAYSDASAQTQITVPYFFSGGSNEYMYRMAGVAERTAEVGTLGIGSLQTLSKAFDNAGSTSNHNYYSRSGRKYCSNRQGFYSPSEARSTVDSGYSSQNFRSDYVPDLEQQQQMEADPTALRLQALLEQMKQLQRAAQLESAESYNGAKLVFRLNPNTCKVGQIVGYRIYYGPNDKGWFYGARSDEIKSWGIITNLETLWSYGKMNTVATVEWDAGIFTGRRNVEDLFLL